MKKIIMIILVFVLSTIPIFVEDDWLHSDETEAIFEDINSEDWYYEPVMLMNRYGVIQGYGDKTFRPKNEVNREQFATMMVRTLGLEPVENISTFVDVDVNYWSCKYIEAAKPYLTGFKSSGQVSFKPKAKSVREDMAVALVKALKKEVSKDDLKLLDKFEDKGDISKNLREFIACAVKNKLMDGYEIDGKFYIKPQNTLTRAEAAALLLKVIKAENLDFGEEKIVFEDTDIRLSAKQQNGGIQLKWKSLDSSVYSSYKVVACVNGAKVDLSKNGYVAIVKEDNLFVKAGDKNSEAADFDVFEAGKEYRFKVIGKKDGTYKELSNEVVIEMPKKVSYEDRVTTVSAKTTDKGVIISWSPIDKEGLQGYKVVASKTNKNPVYPKDGYAKWIRNLDTLEYEIKIDDAYVNGDFKSFKGEESYYFSITAIYTDDKIVPGNSVYITLPKKEDNSEEEVEQQGDFLLGAAAKENGGIKLTWNNKALDKTNFRGYKIVISKNDDTPVYPENGYLAYIEDYDRDSYILYPGKEYKNGDFDKVKSNEKYYIAITVLYHDGKKIVSNTQEVTLP